MSTTSTDGDDAGRPRAQRGTPNPPKLSESAFDCPYCGVFAQMESRTLSIPQTYPGENVPVSRSCWVRCDNCRQEQYWIIDTFGTRRATRARMVFPIGGDSTAPQAHPDMPASARADFDEARAVVGVSIRGACALLRLATEKLVQELQPEGGTLNERIGLLVKGGVAPQIQQGLDTLRVIGNEAVHPGELDLADDSTTASGLFNIMNMMVEEAITRPRHLREMYQKLPAKKLEGIANRDAANSTTETP